MITNAARWSKDKEGLWISFRLPYASIEEAEALTLNVSTEKPKKLSLKDEHRSLDANAYLWVLVGKIADKTDIPPKDVYREMIRSIGNNYEVIPLKEAAVKSFKEAWESKGIGWIVDILGESKFRGYTNVVAWYGSSVYDKRQFSKLIDRAIEDAKELGIETLPPDKLRAMLGEDKEDNY